MMKIKLKILKILIKFQLIKKQKKILKIKIIIKKKKKFKKN